MAQEIKQPMNEATYINHVRKVLVDVDMPTTMIRVVLQYMTYAYRMGVAWQKQQQEKQLLCEWPECQGRHKNNGHYENCPIHFHKEGLTEKEKNAIRYFLRGYTYEVQSRGQMVNQENYYAVLPLIDEVN